MYGVRCSDRTDPSDLRTPDTAHRSPGTLLNSAPNVILVGFMGTGKSVVGQQLALRRDLQFVDTDALVTAVAGMSIPEIFASEGEERFRERESAVLRSLLGSVGLVVATGGGILGRDENVALLRELGCLVCLTARPEVILERTRPWEDRPLLAQAPDPLVAVRQLLTARAARYALAELCVDSSDHGVEEVVEEICHRLP